MSNKKLTRRRLLASAAGLGAGLTLPEAMWAAGADQPAPRNAADARHRLIDGNKRFVAGESIHDHTGKEWRKRLTAGQKPFAVILGCSDSRVPTELIFDQGFGDLQFLKRHRSNREIRRQHAAPAEVKVEQDSLGALHKR